MNVQTAAAVAAALVGMAFSMATFERWLSRHRRHELAWSVALAMFAIAAAALAAGAGTGWNGPVFRTFYYFGAIANVPVLALGTIYLLAGARRGDRWAAGIGLFVAFAAGVITVAPLTAPIPADELVQGKQVFGPLPRMLAALSSGLASVVIVGGAVWSAWRLARSVPGSGRQVVANGLIAAGTVILAMSGLLNSVMGEMTGFAVTLLIGITIIFAGFLVASSAPRRPAAPPVRVRAGAATASRSAREEVRAGT